MQGTRWTPAPGLPNSEVHKRALVVGGSIAGLCSAVMLHRSGWDVHVYERSAVELSGRGAGIVTHPELIDILEGSGAGTIDLGVPVEERRTFDASGAVIGKVSFRQIVTSWDRLYHLFRVLIPAERYHLGYHLTRIDEHADFVRATFANGVVAEGDLLVGADGFRSAVRRHYVPDVEPEYAGYVCWRGLVEETDIAPAMHAEIFPYFAFFLPPREQILGYPIAGSGNDLRPGRRRYNWLWYRPVDRTLLEHMLTDDAGATHHMSIAPPLIGDAVIAEMRAYADSFMAPPFRDLLRAIARPFFAPIYDHASPRIALGRVALVGDAAFVGRPHVGMGVTKAAGDARALAECLARHDDVVAGLQAYEHRRLPVGRRVFERGRELGAYMGVNLRTAAERAAYERFRNPQAMMRDTADANFLSTA